MFSYETKWQNQRIRLNEEWKFDQFSVRNIHSYHTITMYKECWVANIPELVVSIMIALIDAYC